MNQARLNRMPIATIIALLALVTVARSAETPTVEDQGAEIASLVEQVVDNESHREATEKLLQIGQPAVAPLAKAVEVDDAAVVTRCFDVLGRLLVSEDPKTAEATQKAIEKLTESEIDIVGRRARTTLRLKEILRRREAMLKDIPPAVLVGRATRMTTVEDGKTIQLERDANGAFSGTIKETIDGKDQETEIQAANEKELEQKFPDAHKAFQKQEQRLPQVGGVPVPNPAIPPGIPRAGIRINGQFLGGAGGQSVKISVTNNKRHIESQNGDEKVEITDIAGKDIELKHTRTVDGKSKTDEYKAADLDELKKKHPEAAKLYEKHAANNLNFGGAGGAGGAIQLQVRAGAVPGGPFQIEAPNFQSPGSLSQPTGPRTIRAELDGRKIEITDEDGMKIRVKLIKLVDGKEVSQEFSADNLKLLKSEHPQAAALYEQLTGRSAE
jgi:hypothetical protein